MTVFFCLKAYSTQKFHRNSSTDNPSTDSLLAKSTTLADIIKITQFYWRLGVAVSVVGRINEVNQHRARLVHDG